MKEVYLSAVYVQCNAHKLNLVLVDFAKKIQFACDFFLLLEGSMYSSKAHTRSMYSSKAHTIFVAMQKKLHPEKQVRQLPKLSDTFRWVSGQAAVNTICYT